MSPLRFFGSFVAGRLSSARRLIHQSRNLAGDVGGFGFSGSLPMGGKKLPASIVTVGTLSSALVGATLYLKKDMEEPTAAAWGLNDVDVTTLEEVIADEKDAAKEAAMKSRFEEWMVKYERRYESEEEKVLRYREFKRHFKDAEKANALGSGQAIFAPNGLGDLTEEESLSRRTGDCDMTPAKRLMYKLHCDMIYRRAVEWWIQR